MAGGYNLSASNVTLANQAVTLTFVNPAGSPNMDLSFRRFWVSQSNNMPSAQQRVQLNTQVSGFPTLVAATPARLYNVDTASIISGNTTGAAGTAGINASAEGTGAKTILWADTFNVINGWMVVLTPDEYVEMSSGSNNGLGMHLPVPPGTLTNWTFGCNWLET